MSFNQKRLCRCGCGEEVKLSTSNGVTRPSRYKRGHHMRRKSLKKELVRRAAHARLGMPKHRSEETKEKLRLANIGKIHRPHTEATKRKISLASKALWQTKSHRATMRKKMQALWKDKEYRNKITLIASTDKKFRRKISLKKSRTIRNHYAIGLRTPPWINGLRITAGQVTTIKGGVVSYRGSWERFFIALLESSKIVKTFKYQPFGIAYKFKGKYHTYFPDFLVTLKNKSTWVVEVKGRSVTRDKAKYKAAYKYCQDHGHEWVIVKEKPLQPITEYLQ